MLMLYIFLTVDIEHYFKMLIFRFLETYKPSLFPVIELRIDRANTNVITFKYFTICILLDRKK